MAVSDNSATQFSVAVVGLGVIGSAACRHLSCLSSDPRTIIGVGAAEPSMSSTVFSSHGDQGRVARVVDRDPVWSHLAAKSILSYKDVESKSAISFHGRVGFIRVSPFYGTAEDSLRLSLEVGLRNGADATLLQDGRLEFPFFGFNDGDVAVIEHGGAGYVNPIEMIKAQLAIAERNGVQLIRETVSRIEPLADGCSRVYTDTGRTFQTAKLLLCAGAYTNFLLPRNLKLSAKIKAVSVLLAEVDEEEVIRLKGMPSFIWRLNSHPLLHSVYGCPPIKYPDEKSYIKLGGTERHANMISTEHEILDWFRGPGSKTETDALLEVLLELLPGLRIQSLKTKPCMVSHSAHDYPYIDKVAEGLFVAAFGCGAAAKSGEEIGKMASLLVHNGEWSYSELDASLFRAVFVEDSEMVN